MPARKTRFVIPEGELDTVDASGKPVDVGALGAQEHVSVIEAGNIYDAYKLFTGKTLPRLPASEEHASSTRMRTRSSAPRSRRGPRSTRPR